MGLDIGALFSFPLCPGDPHDDRRGTGKVLAVDHDVAGGDVVGVALSAVIWTCEPLPNVADEAPRLIDHVPLRPSALAGVTWLGRIPVRADELAGYAAWRTAVERPVVDAPPGALIEALLAEDDDA